MKQKIDISKIFKALLAVCCVLFMLTACSGNEKSQSYAQGPVETASGDGSSLAAGVNAKRSDGQCWQTEVVDVLYNIMGKVALETYRKMTGGALALSLVGFAIWMSWRLLKQLGSFKEETMGEVWTEIAKMFFLCLVCGLIASRVNLLTFVLGDFIFPIYNAFLEFAGEILTTAVPKEAAKEITILSAPVKIDTQFTCAVDEVVKLTADAQGFPDSPKQMMDCMICAIDNALSFGMTLAFETLRGKGFTGWCVGFFVLACFLFVKLGFVFYLVDTIFRFTIMVIMLPIMILGYPFPKTKGLLSQGVTTMVNSAAFMMFFALVLTMCVQAIATILQKFSKVLDGQHALEDLSVPFICMMLIAFLVISSIKIAGTLCSSLVGGGNVANSQFQKSAKALIVGAAKWVLSFGTRIVSVAMPKSLKDTVNRKMEGVMNLKNKIGGAANKLTGGD